jgi:hypothetical protein
MAYIRAKPQINCEFSENQYSEKLPERELATHIHLGPRLRISGAIPVLPLYAFMALTQKTLLLYVQCEAENLTVFKTK